jgi:hypothetical protein
MSISGLKFAIQSCILTGDIGQLIVVTEEEPSPMLANLFGMASLAVVVVED